MNDLESTTAPVARSQTLLARLADIFSAEPRNQEDLVTLIKAAEQRGLLDNDILSIMLGAVHLGEMKVREIMVPRSQMACISIDHSAALVLETITRSAHSRFPVLGEDSDEVIGILLAKDLLPLVEKQQLKNLNVKDLVRPAAFVPQSKRLHVLLREFKANRNHMAIVVDEYGEVAGLVTIEDVLEQIVGDIEDEHDDEENGLIKASSGRDHIVKAHTPIEEFNEHFQASFDENEFDTIGGVVMHHFGHLPKRNETIKVNAFVFKILNADQRSIRLLQVTPPA